jgi:PAS domain S-box-containing protein
LKNNLQFRDTLLATAQENSPDGILVVDEAGQIISFNQKFVDIWSISLPALEPHSEKLVLQLVLDKIADPESFMTRVNYLHEHTTEKSHEEVVLKDGRTLERYSAPMVGQQNEYFGRVWYFRDISELKRTEAALWFSEQRLKIAVASGQIGIWEYNLQTKEVIWDDTMYALYGAKREDFSAAYDAWSVLVHPEDLAPAEAALQDAINGIKGYEPEFRIIWPNGEVHYIKGHGRIIKDQGGIPVRMIGTNWDNWANANIQQQLKLANTAIDMSRSAFYRICPAGKVLYANDAACHSLGYSRDELLNMHVWDFDPDFPPEAWGPLWEELKQNRSVNIETRHRRKDGTIFPVEVIGSIIYADGDEYSFTFARDITERKQRQQELELYRWHLEELVKERTAKIQEAYNELESFSYSVSHDLRAPLRSMTGFGHILIEDYGHKLDDECKRLLNVVCDEAVRMGQLIDNLLEFSRTNRIELKRQECDMTQLARNVYDVLTEPLLSRSQLFELKPLPSAEGDPVMLRQVLFNLLANAIKFSSLAQTPEIEVGATTSGEMNTYYVRDNGVGFDQQYAHKLFGIFQRLHTEDEFEGTGVGLALVQRIVVRHGGKVWAKGTLDAGATFYFSLPVLKKAQYVQPG